MKREMREAITTKKMKSHIMIREHTSQDSRRPIISRERMNMQVTNPIIKKTSTILSRKAFNTKIQVSSNIKMFV